MKINFIDTVHPVLSERLTVAGHTCEDLSGLEGEELLRQLHDAEGLVIRGRIMLDAITLAHAPSLRFIARAGAGNETGCSAGGSCGREAVRLQLDSLSWLATTPSAGHQVRRLGSSC